MKNQKLAEMSWRLLSVFVAVVSIAVATNAYAQGVDVCPQKPSLPSKDARTLTDDLPYDISK